MCAHICWPVWLPRTPKYSSRQALIHATASEKAKANSHTEEAIKHLEQAIDEGKEGHADVATTDAEAALTHLEQLR
jgi:hypothetical protein